MLQGPGASDHLGTWKYSLRYHPGIQIRNAHFSQIPEGLTCIIPFEKPGVEEEVGSGERVTAALRRGLVLWFSW